MGRVFWIHVDFLRDFLKDSSVTSGIREFGPAGYDFGGSKIGVLMEHLFDAYLLVFVGEKMSIFSLSQYGNGGKYGVPE